VLREWQTTQARVHKRPHRSAWLQLLPPVSLVACCCGIGIGVVWPCGATRWPPCPPMPPSWPRCPLFAGRCSLGVVACRARLERESTSAIPPAPLHTRVHSSHSATWASLASSSARRPCTLSDHSCQHAPCLPRPATACRSLSLAVAVAAHDRANDMGSKSACRAAGRHHKHHHYQHLIPIRQLPNQDTRR
jgi:hypothetical protein